MSTSTKIAFGYLLLIGLLIGSIKYIYQQMELLSARSDTESLIDDRRQTTHKIVSQLYDIEIIGQTLYTGKAAAYRNFNRKMREVQRAIDTLQAQQTDSLQCQRLDTLRALLRYKSSNVRAVSKALQRTPADEIYQQQFDSLLTQQDSLINSSHVRRRVITHHNTYTIHKKPKGFFKRVANVFKPGKADSVEVNNVVQEEIIDTLEEAYNPIDTIASMLTGIHSKVMEAREQELRTLDAHVQRLRIAGSDLSKRVNQLLETIEREEREAAHRKMLQEREIRYHAAWTMATISIIAVILVIAFFTIIWRDLTRSNHYRKELEKAKLYAENLLVAREKLMLTITHDIKAPAGSIIGYLDLLNRLITDKRQLFYLNNMQSAAHHLLNLVTSLLDFHRLEAGKMDLNPVSFKPYQLLEDIYHCFLPLAEKKQLKLQLQLELKPNLTLEGDPFRLRQIVENLLSNALKFTAEGTITLQSNYQGNQFVIRVNDTGCGMTNEEQLRIFNEFTRLHSAQGQEGFGLGLSITRKLIDLLQGNIHVDSIPHVGSTFVVSIPLPSINEKTNGAYKTNNETADNRKAPSEVDTITAEPNQTPDEDSSRMYEPNNTSNEDKNATSEQNDEILNKKLSSLKILAIDDDSIQLQLTKAMLHRVLDTDQQTASIRCCQQPEEILRLLSDNTQRYDLLFTDIQMPAMNGFELLKAVRELPTDNGKQIAVVAITARGDINEEGFKEKGFAGMLQKPFNMSDLRNVLQRITSSFRFDSLLAFTDGDEDAGREIMATFIKETERHITLIEQAIATHDYQRLCEIGHKMLPTFTMIEAGDAVEALQWLDGKRGADFGETAETSSLASEAEEKAKIVVRYANAAMKEAKSC